MSDDALTPTEQVYGNLIVEHHNAHRKNDLALAERIFAATLVFKELWPKDCERWEARFSEKTET